MITLTITNDQADALAPYLDTFRQELARRIVEAANPKLEEELSRATAVLGQLAGQINTHQRQCRTRPTLRVA